MQCEGSEQGDGHRRESEAQMRDRIAGEQLQASHEVQTERNREFGAQRRVVHVVELK